MAKGRHSPHFSVPAHKTLPVSRVDNVGGLMYVTLRREQFTDLILNLVQRLQRFFILCLLQFYAERPSTLALHAKSQIPLSRSFWNGSRPLRASNRAWQPEVSPCLLASSALPTRHSLPPPIASPPFSWFFGAIDCE